ncbi:alpha/beta hydrolase [Corynebacterium lubricantis]|uniref:alpha/beta hydrolase n=1 Tax=Corynebacterium lubricantis TaxID=541095 RepID=UPI00035D7710|nr:alpha/beta fold hydrolase [Corynebacterium lubricantis]
MLTSILISIGITLIIYFGLALGFTFSQAPKQRSAAEKKGIGFSSAVDADYSSLPALSTYQARNGSRLPYRRYEEGNDRLIVLIHGSAWHGMQFHPMASALAARGLGTVVVPDLRGHGDNPQRRGDIDYIGQLEDDLADLIAEMQSEQNYGEVVVGGHSSGGGLVVRFAGGKHGHQADRFVLMAPFLKYNAPTTKPNSGNWAYPATRRIIGLTMLNNVGITALNHLPVISFAMPQEVLDGPLGSTVTTQYSFRLNTGFAPRSNYKRDLAALQQPFLLIAGANDESFKAEQYEPVIAAQTKSGTYKILEGTSHIGVTTDTVAIKAIGDWVQGSKS